MPSPADFLVPALDGLIYVAAYIVLCLLLILSIKIPTRGNAQTGLINAMIVVCGAVLVEGYVQLNIVSWIPDQGSRIHLGAIIGASFLTIVVLVIWRFALPILITLFCSLCTTAGLVALGIYIPRISEAVLPEGPTFAEFIGMAQDTIKESEQAAREIAAMMNKGKDLEALAKNKKGAFAAALQAIAELTTEEEMTMLENDFNAGLDFWRERKELMDKMTPEEKEAYRRSMASFLQENGLAENRYSLSAIKDVSKEDLMNAASFMSDLNGDFDSGAPPMNEKEVADASDSLAKIAQNIKGGSLSRLEKDGLNKMINILSSQGLDAALEETKKEMDDLLGDNAVTGAMFATLLELKSGYSAAEIITEAQIFELQMDRFLGDGSDTDGPRVENTSVAEVAPEEEEAIAVTRRSSVEVIPDENSAPDLTKLITPEWKSPEGMETLKTPRDLGMVLIPESIPKKKSWLEAAGQISVKGFVVAGAEGEDIRAIIGNTTIGMSDKLSIRHEKNEFTFKVSEIAYGRLYITAISIK